VPSSDAERCWTQGREARIVQWEADISAREKRLLQYVAPFGTGTGTPSAAAGAAGSKAAARRELAANVSPVTRSLARFELDETAGGDELLMTPSPSRTSNAHNLSRGEHRLAHASFCATDGSVGAIGAGMSPQEGVTRGGLMSQLGLDMLGASLRSRK
jgi:hypothetical protein